MFVGKPDPFSPRPYRFAGIVCTITPETGFHTRWTEKFSRSRKLAIVAAEVVAGSFSVECHTIRGRLPEHGPASMLASRCTAHGRNISGIASLLPFVGLEIALFGFERLRVTRHKLRLGFRHDPLR